MYKVIVSVRDYSGDCKRKEESNCEFYYCHHSGFCIQYTTSGNSEFAISSSFISITSSHKRESERDLVPIGRITFTFLFGKAFFTLSTAGDISLSQEINIAVSNLS